MNNLIIHGHRGSRGTHPENTITSFAEASNSGAHFVELDVHLSKEGIPIVYHDFSLSGEHCLSSDGAPIPTPIPIYELTVMELKTFDCGSVQQKRFPEQILAPEKIPTLEELILWKKKRTINLNIEIKHNNNSLAPSPEKLAMTVLALLEKHHLIECSLVQSFELSVVKELRKLNNRVRLSCLFEKQEDFVAIALNHQAQFVAPHYPLIDQKLVTEASKSGLEVLPWTVNEPQDWQKLMQLGVRSIITDFPRRLRNFSTI